MLSTEPTSPFIPQLTRRAARAKKGEPSVKTQRWVKKAAPLGEAALATFVLKQLPSNAQRTGVTLQRETKGKTARPEWGFTPPSHSALLNLGMEAQLAAQLSSFCSQRGGFGGTASPACGAWSVISRAPKSSTKTARQDQLQP